jgi:hypothetical protein
MPDGMSTARGSIPLLGAPYQVAYVTEHLDAAIAAVCTLGAARFLRIDDVELHSEGGDAARIAMALGWVGTAMFEFIEPLGGQDDVFRSALPVPPQVAAFHHICYRLGSPDALEDVRARYAHLGIPMLFPSDTPTRARFFYADLRPTLGHLIEYLYVAPERAAFHRDLPKNPGVPESDRPTASDDPITSRIRP